MPSQGLIYTGIRDLELPDNDRIELGGGLFLVRPNESLLSGRMRYAQSEHEYEEGGNAPSTRTQTSGFA